MYMYIYVHTYTYIHTFMPTIFRCKGGRLLETYIYTHADLRIHIKNNIHTYIHTHIQTTPFCRRSSGAKEDAFLAYSPVINPTNAG